MNIAAFKKDMVRLDELMNSYESDKYTCSRDEDANLIVTFNDGEVVKIPIIAFRNYQIELQKKLHVEGILRFFLARPRRAGKEVESFSMVVQGAIEKPGLYVMIYPTGVRAKAVLWDGNMILQDGSVLPFLEMIPKRLIRSINNVELKVYLKNNSVIWILGSDVNPDKLRGTNPRGVVISEAAFCDPRVRHILMPVLRQNFGWLICQSTFNGVNHFYKLWQTVKEDPLWYVRKDSIENLKDDDGNRYITDEMVDEDRRAGMPEYLIKQEYYSEVQLNEESMFFSMEMANIHDNNKIVSELFFPEYSVYGFWDLGVNDCTVVLLVQFDHNNNPCIIYCIEENNKNIHYYLDKCTQFCTKHGLYIDSHFAPHDGVNRSLQSGDNVTYVPKSCVDIARELGHRFTVVERPKRKIDAINSMRIMLNKTKFSLENTERLIECLSTYGKQFDEKAGEYRNTPFPKWATHCVDAYQTMTIAIQAEMVQNNLSHDVIYYD
jgi:hypothetical protein